jgi:hypothetical protein
VPVANNTIRQVWLFLDNADAPLAGMLSPGDVELILKRDSGSGTVTATETVTWTALGLGYYEISFTPTQSGIYSLFLHELNVGSMMRRWLFTFEVIAAGSVFAPAYTDAFCAETDIERWLQESISSTTKPSDTEAAAFAVSRAALLMAVCEKYGVTTTPTTITAGSRLLNILRDCNAIGAALDYTTAQSFGVMPSRTDRISAFDALWRQYVYDPANPKAMGILALELNNETTFPTDHILSGDTAASGQGQGTDMGIQVSMTDVY